MSKALNTINIHTIIRKVLQTNIPGTIIKFIANYIKGRKAYTTYRNHTSSQRQFKSGVPQGQHYSTYTLQTYHHQEHQFRSWPTQMTSHHIYTHTSTSGAKKYIQPYLQNVFAWTKQNNLLLNLRQNNLHSVHSRPCRI